MGNTPAAAFSEVSKVAPYVIAAYALLWASLVVYVGLVMRRLAHLESEVRAVEEAIARRAEKA